MTDVINEIGLLKLLLIFDTELKISTRINCSLIKMFPTEG